MMLEPQVLTRPTARTAQRPGPVRAIRRSWAPVTAVLGAGHGGLALAAQLALHGVPVRLWNRSPARLAPVSALGGIRFQRAESTEPQLACPAGVSCQVADAVSGAEVILVAVPATGHADVARRAAPFLQDGQVILLLPGRTGGALEFLRTLRQEGCRARLLVGEAQSFPFASRTVAPGSAVVHRVKREVPVAAVPAHRTPELLALCRPLLPILVPAESALNTSFDNMGCILHPGITLGNRRRIRAREQFLFYCEGVTPPVAGGLQQLDAERVAVAAAYGVQARSLMDWLAVAYDRPAGDLAQMIAGNPGYQGIYAPTTLDHRYLWEDVPTGLVPIAALGAAAGVPTPAMNAAIAMASRILGVPFRATGRSTERLGLTGLTPREVEQMVVEGSLTA